MAKNNKLIRRFIKLPPSTKILILIILFLIINLPTLNHWYFSIIGDEYSFYIFAKYINFSKLKVFCQSGVYGVHPILSSIYQATIMRIFGNNNLGWRLSSLFIVPLSIPGVYLIGKELFNKEIGLFSATTFSLSFYLFGYAHTGYNNIQAIFPFIYGIYIGILGYSKKKELYSIASGFLCGLGWYTFYTSRITIFLVSIIFILAFLRNMKSQTIKNFCFLLLSFFLTITPLLATNGKEIITKMFEQSIINQKYYGTFVDNPITRFFVNFKLNFFCFISGNGLKHFVSAPVLDPISRIFTLIGIFITIKNIRKFKYSLILIFYVSLTIMVSFNPIKEVVISRLHLNLSILTIFSGIGWYYINNLISKKYNKAGNLFLIVITLSILILNIYIFYWKIPSNFPLNKEALIIKAIQKSNVPVIIYEGKNINRAFREVVTAYNLKQKVLFVNAKTEQSNSLTSSYFLINNDKNKNEKENNKLLNNCPKLVPIKFYAPNKNIWLDTFKCKK